MLLKTSTQFAAERIIALDALANFVIGCALFFAPQKVGDFVFRRQTDGVHWHLIRCVGGQLLANAFVLRRLGARRRAAETRTTCFVLRAMAGAFVAFVFGHARSANATLIEPMFYKAIMCWSAAAILYSLVFLAASGWPLGKHFHAASPFGNFLYQLDSFVAAAIGMAWISQPKWLLHSQVNVTLDESHELCGQIIGVLFFASQVLAMHALYWKEREDRWLATDARVICGSFIMLGQIWSQLAYGAHWSGSHWVGISIFTTWTTIFIAHRIGVYITTTASAITASANANANANANSTRITPIQSHSQSQSQHSAQKVD